MSPYEWLKTGVAVVSVGLFAYLVICLVRGAKSDDEFDA